jgi:hypothetical protein
MSTSNLLATFGRATWVAAAAAGCLAGAPALAAIDFGDGDQDGEFSLSIWDEQHEVSYTIDLGYRMNSLLAEGQSDAGFQKFWKLDRSMDANLAKLLDLGAAVNSLRWGVYAVDIGPYQGEPNIERLYTTLEHLTPTGTVNPNFTNLLARNDGNVISMVANTSLFLNQMNLDVNNANNLHGPLGGGGAPDNYGFNGTAFIVKGQTAYFGDPLYTMSNLGDLAFPSTLNTIGRSSWAYSVTYGGNFDNEHLALVDEFDNLTHDGFWGLVEDPNEPGVFYLSYTLEAVGLTQAQREFALGIGRTEFNRGFTVRKLDGIAAAGLGESPTGWSRPLLDMPQTMVAVPEPQTWLLMGLGLAATLRAARRRRA